MVESRNSLLSPDAALREFFQRFFVDGTCLASLRYHIAIEAVKMPLRAFLRGGPTMAPPPLPNEADLRTIFHSEKNDQRFMQIIAAKYPWDSSKTAAELVAVLCSDLDDIDARVRAAAFHSRSMGGLPNLAQIRMEPSASLVAALEKSIAVQKGGQAARAVHNGHHRPSSSTCLIVSLTDCAMLKATEQYNQSVVHYTSYGHSFALIVDSSGVGMYQAWGNHGRGGDTGTVQSPTAGAKAATAAAVVNAGATGGEANGNGQEGATGDMTITDWLDRSPQPMSYEQTLEFGRAFDEFCGRITWDDDTNRLYHQLFGVDMAALAAVTGLPPPARIKSWVRILEIPGVTAARVQANSVLFL